MTNIFKFKKLTANAKKAILLSCMVALLVVTGVLSFVFNDKIANKGNVNVGGTPSNVQETFFSNYRTTRETTRNGEMLMLDAIMASADCTPETKLTAEQKKIELLSFIETELILENLIKARGIKDAVVSLSTKNVNVIVGNSEQILKQANDILSIVVNETNFKSSQVFVIPLSV